MGSTQRLLMATDLSARSDRALERAVALAGETQAILTVLHVVDEDLPARIAGRLEQLAKQSIQDHLDSLPGAAGLRLDVSVRFGNAHDTIVQVSEEIDAGLLILGVHREHAIKDLFRSTTVERALRLGNRPVLLVKERVRGPYQRVLVAVDFSIGSRRALEFAVGFVPQGEFKLVHAYDVPFRSFLDRKAPDQVSRKQDEQTKRMVQEAFAGFLAPADPIPPRLRYTMKEGPALSVLREEAALTQPDLLVLGSHGRTGIAHAMLGSVTEELLRDPPCDILALKAW